MDDKKFVLCAKAIVIIDSTLDLLLLTLIYWLGYHTAFTILLLLFIIDASFESDYDKLRARITQRLLHEYR